jgi:hypothetical protein
MNPDELKAVSERVSEAAGDSPVDVVLIPNDEIEREVLVEALKMISQRLHKTTGLHISFGVSEEEIVGEVGALPTLAPAAVQRDHMELPSIEHLLSHIGASASPARYVTEFHRAFEAPIRATPGLADTNRELRQTLLQEEFDEYMLAEDNDDLVEIADGLLDMIYIIYGTGLTYGIDMDAGFAEVHRSNMSKLADCPTCHGYGAKAVSSGDFVDCAPCKGSGKKVVRREDGKVMKSVDFDPPRLAVVLGIETSKEVAS